ncbi:endonuclease/exonuclease/phosphatase family protein [Kribbella sp. NBC_01245]|uniref:endonuclease/exonuclease/phosphatase family protein n=1 Tax=Kribbella sp. NBC_01245 TaxID=2903578 RepID=UPI002E29B29C|nr:endonuclease/exonuclease/phosphatase family protein [Kribbella sp. NBC_01245]
MSDRSAPPDSSTATLASAGSRGRRPSPKSGKWRRGWFIAFLAVLVILPILLHRQIPNSVGNLGSLVDTFLPWVGAAIPVLAVLALIRKSATAGIAVVVALAVWLGSFGNALIPGKGGGDHNVTVLTHNVDAANTDPAGTARSIIAAGADIVALEEITSRDLPVYKRELGGTYKHVAQRDTVALWSRYPIADTGSVDIGFAWTRALRARVSTPEGDIAVYVAHLASVRVGTSGFTSNQRNDTIRQLGQAISKEELAGVVVMGDFNGTVGDRSLAPITAGLRSAQGAAGYGFGFTWPAEFPMARIDHILVRGVVPTKAWVLPATGSDHRPIIAQLRI